MSKYKFKGGNVFAIYCKVGKVYDSFLDSDGDVNIIDDHCLSRGYTKEIMINNNIPSIVNYRELTTCFEEVAE